MSRNSKKRRGLKQGYSTAQENHTSHSRSFNQDSILPEIRKMEEKGTDAHPNTLLNLIRYANIMELFKESIIRFKGTNSLLNYKASYNFRENWEETSRPSFEKNENVYFSSQGIAFLISMLVMFHKIPMVWFLSIYNIFKIQNHEGISTGTICFFLLLDILLRLYLIYQELIKHASKQEIAKNSFKINVFKLMLIDIITCLAYALQRSIHGQCKGLQISLDFIIVFVQFIRFLQIYDSLAIVLISYKKRNYVNLLGFASKIFIVLHICGIIVYSVSLMDNSHNWLRSIDKHDADPWTRYIYSVYFTGTTMFTVGYGDIIPKNNFEIIVIIIIQALGIIIIGYIISEIGHTLTAMRQARDDFQQDIQNADTICHNYQLNSDLRHRVRNYVVNNRIANEQLNVQEENNLLMKLNEQLRNEVNHENHLRIIKTSLFFICNWTKKLQMELSKKLEKCVYAPNQSIIKQNKLFIVANGKVDIYTDKKFKNKVMLKKLLKTIDRDPSKEVYSNVFGCTSLFTAKTSSLSAIAKDFAICYALDYSDILQALKDDERDFQLYHEIKSKLQQQNFPQKYEIPNLINNKQHYCPKKYFVLKKNKKESRVSNERKSSIRSMRKNKLLCMPQKEQKIAFLPENTDSEPELTSEEEVETKIYNDDTHKSNKIESQKMKIQSKEQHQPILNLPQLVLNECKKNIACLSYRSYRRRFLTKLDQERLKAEQMRKLLEESVVNTSLFQTGKHYQKYFAKGNCQRVLLRQSKDPLKEIQALQTKVIQLQWIDLLVFAQRLHKNTDKQPILQ